MKTPLTLLLCLVAAVASAATDAFPVSRRGGLPSNDWRGAGIPGGIPFVSTEATNIDVGITAANLNTVIAATTSNQVITFDAGTYNFLGNVINLTKSGVVLRGATNSSGYPTTVFTNLQLQTATYWGPESGSGNFPSVTVRGVSSGYTEGSQSITLATAPNSDFAVGSVFVIDQTDDSVNVWPDSNSGLYTRSGRAYCQTLLCTNISGSVLGFTPPLLGTYWASGRTPQVYGWASTYGTTVHRVGLENILFRQGSGDAHGNQETIKFMGAYQSWMKNVRVRLEQYAASALMWSVNCEFNGNIYHDTDDDGSSHYGVLLAVATGCRVENNIFTNLSLACTQSSAVGCSISFNYSTPPYPYSTSSWLAEQFFPHGGHVHHNLFEGAHITGPIEADDVFGNSSSDNGVVRNRILGYATNPVKSGNAIPFILGEGSGSLADHRNWTLLGNSLGTVSFHNTYGSIYSVDAECTGMITTNNWNAADGGIHSTETMGDYSVADSYAYASKPAWFGNRSWPAYGPSSYGVNAYTNIPAGYRSFYGTDVPADSSAPASPAYTMIPNARIRQ